MITSCNGDEEDNQHKMKALEINAQRFYHQVKPLFQENNNLKSDLIELNIYMEERKNHLCKYLPDIGPNGEDQVLAKAVGDLEQITLMIGEEFQRLNTTISNQKSEKELYESQIKEIKQKYQNNQELHIQEKQQLIDQTIYQQQAYTQLQDELFQKLNRQQAKYEDLLSFISKKNNFETLLKQQYEDKLKNQTMNLNEELQSLRTLYLTETDKYDTERRQYLKQLETFSNRLKEIKQETLDECEYKINALKIKFEHQIKLKNHETQDLKLQIKSHQDKQKMWSFQHDTLIEQKYQLELQLKDLKFYSQQLEDKITQQEDYNLALQDEINQHKDTISKLKSVSSSSPIKQWKKVITTVKKNIESKQVDDNIQCTQETQTEESRSRITSFIRLKNKQGLTNQETQYDEDSSDTEYINFKQELLISQLNIKLSSLQQMCDLKLQQRQQDNEDLQKQLQEQETSHQQQLKILENDFRLMYENQLASQQSTIKLLKNTLQEYSENNVSLKETIQLFEKQQDNVHSKYEGVLNHKDEIISFEKHKQQEIQDVFQIEQKRLLELNQNLQKQYEMQIANLQNQHKLDQEQLQQEKQRFNEEQEIGRRAKDNIKMLEETLKIKDQLIDNFKEKLIKQQQDSKYLLLEFENYKKVNNIFKTKDSPSSMLIHDLQEKIRQRMQKQKISKDNPKFGFQAKEKSQNSISGTLPTQLTRGKIKHTRLHTMTLHTSFEQQNQQPYYNRNSHKNLLKFHLLDREDSTLLQINSKRLCEIEKPKKTKRLKSNQRASNLFNKLETQMGEYSDSKLMLHEIFERDQVAVNSSYLDSKALRNIYTAKKKF